MRKSGNRNSSDLIKCYEISNKFTCFYPAISKNSRDYQNRAVSQKNLINCIKKIFFIVSRDYELMNVQLKT